MRYTHDMSKRLQVLVDEREYAEIQDAARRGGMTVSEWVRHVMRSARSDRSPGDTARKLEAIRRAVEYEFPVGDIDQMLAEIEDGYLDDGSS